MPKPAVIVVMGVSGSGKTTVGRLLAQDLGWAFFDADDFHPRANVEKMRRGEALDDDDRWPWLDRLREVTGERVRSGERIVLACSALKRSYRDRLQIVGDDVRFVYLRGDPGLIRKRLESRKDHYMPPDLLESQLAALEEPEGVTVVSVTSEPTELVRQIERAFAL